ncbi:MAG: homoserine O-succinyltransferase, partial [Sphaerochaeta sp.]|uniref:homoserine O-succinyltransferase n=1 Tax=Sphaerochaeta sp. TaxID=1972642 RepID=UPI002A3620D8
TEQQFLRLLGNTALQVELTFLTTATYQSKHTPRSYLQTFYQTFDQIRDRCFDALIITGSPVETLAFEEVAYWQELTEILSWADEHVYSSFFVCWAAQAALYHHYGIGKILLPKKLSGVYSHTVRQKNHPLVRGFDDRFWAPHSRNTAVDESRLSLEHDLVVLSDSEEAGLYLVVSQDGRKVFVTGHSEYDELTLHDEYQRDLAAGLSLEQPSHYYQGEEVQVRWRGHAHLLFSNWLNYHVYQSTPYQLEQLSKVLQHS